MQYNRRRVLLVAFRTLQSSLLLLFFLFFILAVFISTADPLSISASIAGLVALADLIFRSGTKYAKSYRGTSTEVANLIREIRSLSVILHNISLVAFDLEETESPELTTVHEPRPILQPHYLHDCHQLLRRLETGLSRTESSLNSDSGRERLHARIKWPFTSTKSKEMIQDIQRYNQIIHTALAADSLALLKYCLSRQAEIKDGLDKIKGTAEKILDIQVKIALDAKRNQVLRDFGQVNPRGEYETNRKLRLWCSGIPGAGKSVLAAAMIEECLQRNAHDAGKAVAYFFCTYKYERSQHPVVILSSLCMQLAMQCENAFRILQDYHDQLFSSHHLSTKPTAEMLTQILHRICACFTRVYIIVDGIDECDSRVEANVDCLANLALSQGDDVINMALLSRDESIIRTRLEKDFPHVEIEAHTEDLQLYVASELSERIASKRLVGEAKGMFRWVACQLDYMCEPLTDKARREALSKLPPTLYKTYDRILLRIDGYDDTVKRLAISLEEDATTLENDEIVEEEELLPWCSSLVRVDKSSSFTDGKTRIQFAHFTVQEYLQSLKTRNSDHQYPQLRDYTVSHADGVDFFSFLCLRFLTMEDMERFPPTRDTSRTIDDILAQRRRRTFYGKSVLTWTSYTTPPLKMEGRTHKLLRKLLHPFKTPAFCLWAIDFIFCHHPSSLNTSSESRKILSQAITAVIRPEFTPLHMASAFSMRDVCQELLESGSDVLACSRFGTPFHFQLLLNVSMSPLATPLPSETILSLTLSCPDTFTNNLEIVIELVKAGVSITAQDVQLFRIRYDRYLQMPSFTSETSQMWSRFPQLYKTLGDNNTPGSPRFVLRQETGEFILRTGETIPSQSPEDQSLDGASNEEVLRYIHSLIKLNDETGMNAFLTTRRAELAQSTDIDPEHPGWNALHLALFERSYRVLAPLLAFGLGPRADRPDGFKPVHMCCRENTWEALQKLVRFGGSILDTDNLGRTVWHLATEVNSVMVLEELLDLGNVDVALKMTSKHHETPICAAATRLHLEAVSVSTAKNTSALSLIVYEPRFSEATQSLHRFGILSQTSCGMRALAYAFHRAILQDDVQTCKKHYSLGCPLEFLDLFPERPNLNILLPTLLNACLAEGGTFSHKQHSIFNIPLASNNTDGPMIMMNKLQGKALGQGEVTTSRLDSLSAIINQKAIRHQNRTPLFMAAAQNNVKAANALLIHGADVNTTDDRNCTPLFVAVEHGSMEVVELLICRGAHVDVMNTSSYRLLDVAFVQRSWRMLGSWPDPFFSNGVDALVAITYNLRYAKPAIKIEGIRQLCGLGIPGTHCLLCRASCWGSVTAIQNLIKFGISDLEHHCHEHGSPLNAAVQSHRLEAVKSHYDGRIRVLLRASWNTPNEDIGLKLSTRQVLFEILNCCDQKRDVAACRVLNGGAFRETAMIIAEEDLTITQRRKTDNQPPTIQPRTPNSGSSIASTDLAKKPMKSKPRNCNAAFSRPFAPSRRIHSAVGTGRNYGAGLSGR
ncbi:uncharacterized protein BKA55DRAFT_593274 [Fusarium redolens]|uniref:Nephrocystin 3-like N-terminal domain-containing protein n=1 Tax=Fusarium redolens TaxID=48865 RepID=A0A9P9H9T4_FUSRE|nr:uncharacterized protein BKA55DRAFT_593274 [Fusarium redolens]KAH7253578.1 hypothetical protein BKA55DRAFT_593274 [Fusarium redolens]